MVTINPYLGVTKQEGYNKRKANEVNRIHMRRFSLNFNKRTERSLIKWMDENKPYQTAIKRLIREQIAREKLEKNK